MKCLAKIVCKFQEQQIGEALTLGAPIIGFSFGLSLARKVLATLSQQVLDGKAEVQSVNWGGSVHDVRSTSIKYSTRKERHYL